MKKVKYSQVDAYDFSADIGTSSIGWCVTDEQGNLLSYKNRHMWGSRLFETGNTAETRRAFRSTRRRLARRVQRIQWLQSLLSPLVLKDDPDFFVRMKYSYWTKADTEAKVKKSSLLVRDLFDDHTYCAQLYQKRFPTIYHLRKALVTENKAFDPKLIYLALHNIIKHRGNFLYDTQHISIKNGLDLVEPVNNFFAIYPNEEGEIIEPGKKFAEILESKNYRADIVKQLAQETKEFFGDEDKDAGKIIANAMVGYKADFGKLFHLGQSEKFSLDNDDAIEKLLDGLTEEQQSQLMALEKVYSAYTLKQILRGDSVTTISDAYINRYEAHKQDLKDLKYLYRSYLDEATYHKMFYDASRKLATYAAYRINDSGKSNRENLYKQVKEDLGKIQATSEDQQLINNCLRRIDEGVFLLKPCNNENGVIPNQLHVEELQAILENQSPFYPELKEVADKIVSIATYRIPYYVGPLSSAARKGDFGWAVRKEEGPVTPWNFDQKIDKEQSAEQFIARMRNTCQYLYGQETLPKHSMLYEYYCVLNELNAITVDGDKLSKQEKEDALHTLFSSGKSVTQKRFRDWLVKEEGRQIDITVPVQGFQSDSGFASTLSSFHAFENILGKSVNKFAEQIEEIIKWITLFQDKTILKKKITDAYGTLFSCTQIEQMCRLNYSGWGKLSAKLLNGITNADGHTVMQELLDKPYPFMKVLYDPAIGFISQINDFNKKQIGAIDPNSYESIFSEITASPSVKKSVWQCLLLLKEITKIMGKAPSHVYLETTKEEGEKKRKDSRFSKLQKLYSDLKQDSSFQEVIQQLNKNKDTYKKDMPLRVFLYFTQNGKCMYSGKPLDIEKLDTYQVDHILPQAYIKNNSISNLALVYPEQNQRKRDDMLLDPEIVHRQRPFWDMLKNKKLISLEKYRALTRDYVDETEEKGFIQRQIVETSQAVSIMLSIVPKVYPNCNVLGVRAGLSSDIRKDLQLFKIRAVNDYHHAQDAYLACMVGRFLGGPLHQAERDGSLWYAFRKEISEQSRILEGESSADRRKHEDKQGFIVSMFQKSSLKGWEGQLACQMIRAAFKLQDYYVTRKTEPQTGAFYNQMLGKKGLASANIKHDRPQEFYGGYTGEQAAYFMVISFQKGKKRILRLVNMPIRIAELEKTQPGAKQKYLRSQYKDPVILRDNICKYQLVKYQEDNGKTSEYYIVSDKEVINARQLRLSQEDIFTLAYWKTKSEIDKENLYLHLVQKMHLYPAFENIASKLEGHIKDFAKLHDEEKRKCIEHMFVIMQANSNRIENFNDLTSDEAKTWGDIPGSRIHKVLMIPSTLFVDQSVSGLFETYQRIRGEDK